MATSSSAGELPNLKIEIDNCMGEPMDVDESGNISDDKHSVDDTEEGEISDSKDCSDHSSPKVVTSVSTMGSVWEKRYENKGGGFVTGVDIFGEKEQSKLGERAARFGLNPSEVKAISEEQLQELYKSLGVKTEDGVEEKRFRLNALHMRGTENMSTQDIFNYFKDYGPASIEWINDYACNVVWLDEISAARAILGLSKEIHGLKPSVQSKRASKKEKSDDTRSEGGMNDEDGTIDDDDVDPNDVDLVVVDQVRSKEGEIIMIIDEVLDKEGADGSKVSNAVNASDITIPIPPGLWRKGVDYPKAKCILLRFTMYSDKKLPRAERLSDYYKRHGNPNYGGIRGLITSSRKRRYQRNGQSQIFDDDLGDERDFGSVDETEDSKNPWGNLARSWSNIDKNRGKQRTDRYYADSPPRKMTPPPSPLLDGSRHSSLLKRLGNTGSSTNLSSRFHSDGFNSDEEQDTSREEDRDWTRRSKVPRMRMYADEEQIRLERRKAVERSHSRRKGSKRERKETRSKSSVKESRKSERRSRESVSKSSDSSKHVSRSRARSREDLRSRLGKDSRGHSGKGKSSSSSSSVSSKWSKVSQKALPSYGHVDLEVDKRFSAHMDSEEEDDSDVGYNDLRDTLRLGKKKGMTFDGEDLRSKLNFKKTLKENSARQKSPLRIEIDNDEYYRLIGNRDSPARKTTPPPSPILDGSRNSPVQTLTGNSGSLTNLSSRLQGDGFNSDEEPTTSKKEAGDRIEDGDGDGDGDSKVPRMHMYADKELIRLERLKAIEHSGSRKKGSENERADSPSKSSDKESSKSERSRECVSKSRDNSIARRRSGSTSSLSVSSKQRTVSQKARRSDGNMKLEVDKHYFAHIDSAENNELGDTLRLGKEKGLVCDGEDLGSKLNFKKSSTENSARQKSPLRTEIDDDEYCRVISNRDSPARKMNPPPSPILDRSLNSPVQKILGNSGSVTNLSLRFPSDGSSSDEEQDTSKNKRDWTRSRVPCMHMDADEEQIRLGINSNVEQDTSKKKGVWTRRKVPRMRMYADEEQIRLRINSNVEQDTSKKKGYWNRSKMPRMRMYADEEQIRLRINSDEQGTSKKKGDWTRTKVPRMRMYADEEQEWLGISCDEEQDTSKKKGDWTRTKVPRMRMYADEEQIRLKRLKAIERSDSRKKGSKRECEDSSVKGSSKSERSRVRICGDLRSKLSKDCRKHSGRVKSKSSSSSSSSVSSKRSKVSQKAQHSDGHGEKLNFKKTSVENSATQTSPQHTRQSSPQRIELDGEEYVRVISYRGSPPRKMTPPPSPILDGSQNSSVQTRPGNSGHLTNLPSRAEINFDKEQDTSKKEDGEQIRLERLKAIEHSDSRKKGSVWEHNNRDSSKHFRRARAMSREDLHSRSGKVSQGHSAKEKNSISSSSKQSNFSQKALLSYGHMDSESHDVSNVSGNVLRDALGFGKRKGMVLHGKDLRSKLNFKKTSKEDSPRPKSTQHIELDGEEYVRVIKYRGSPPRKTTPPPPPVQDGSQNSSVQKRLRNSEEEQIQLEQHETIDHSHSRKEGSESEHKDSRIKSCVVVSRKSERNRESVSKSRESSKHVSRSRARSREDLRSMPGKDSQGHSVKENNSSGSSSSSKQGKISQKALRSYVHVDSHLDVNKHFSAHKDSDDSDVSLNESRDTSRLDLRSKPSCKKTSKENFARQKSPLIGNRDSPPRKMTPPSSPIQDGSRISSVQKRQRNPGRLTNLSSRFLSDGLISEQDTSKKERHKAIEHSDSRKKDSKREGKDSCSKSSVKESSKSEKSRESVSKNRDNSKHASRTRARSSSSSSASSKCSKISRKALHSVVMRTQK